MATGTQTLRIEDLYQGYDDPGVQRFLRENPEVGPALLEAYPHVERFFGPNPRIELELCKGYDSADPEDLFAEIVTQLPTEEAMDRLTALDNALYAIQPYPVYDSLCFSTIRK